MKRNKFSLSHYKNTTMKMGSLVPIGAVEVLPGDTFQHSTSALVRVTPLNTPVMHPVQVRIHHWFVPYRLLWDNFQKFITGGEDGNDASVYPTINSANNGNWQVGSLANQLGIPADIPASVPVSALPFRAYALIFNEFYRDQDLVSPLPISKADGTDSTTNLLLQSCAWEKDYFTSARPWTQKGPSVTLPLGTSAVVKGDGTDIKLKDSGNTQRTLSYAASNHVDYSGGVPSPTENLRFQTSGIGAYADLSDATAVTINTLRNALALQRFEEWRARFGSRYSEYLRSLGVKSSDARLQRPEYLAGGKQTIQFSEVLATNSYDPQLLDNRGVGMMAGHGIAAMRSNRYRRYFEEHGIVMTLMSVRPKTVYYTGLPRMWNRRTKFDFWQPQLEHIGQQAILNKELDVTHGSLDSTFGYQDRYDEYRRHESQVSGLFSPGQIFDSWTMTRDFGSLPTLNYSFVNCSPTTRVFQDTGNDQLLIMANHSIQARRMIAQTGSSFTF